MLHRQMPALHLFHKRLFSTCRCCLGLDDSAAKGHFPTNRMGKGAEDNKRQGLIMMLHPSQPAQTPPLRTRPKLTGQTSGTEQQINHHTTTRHPQERGFEKRRWMIPREDEGLKSLLKSSRAISASAFLRSLVWWLYLHSFIKMGTSPAQIVIVVLVEAVPPINGFVLSQRKQYWISLEKQTYWMKGKLDFSPVAQNQIIFTLYTLGEFSTQQQNKCHSPALLTSKRVIWQQLACRTLFKSFLH